MEMVLVDSLVSSSTINLFHIFDTSFLLFNMLTSMCIVCFLVQGDNTHASVKKELVAQFDAVISEGDSKIMINFALSM